MSIEKGDYSLKAALFVQPVCVCVCLRLAVYICQCVHVYIVSLHRKSSYPDLSHHMHGCLSAVSWGVGGAVSPRAGLIGVKQALVTRDAQRDRKPFIRGLPPTAGLSVSQSVLLFLPISLPLKISHRRSVSIRSLPLPLTLSWLQTFTIYHSSSHPRCSLSLSLTPSLGGIVFMSDVCP